MRKSVLFFLGINAFAVLMYIFNYVRMNNESMYLRNVQLKQNDTISSEKKTTTAPVRAPATSYKFIDPLVAELILKKLDIFEDGEPNVPEGKFYKDPYFGLRINNRYCDEHRAYFVRHPEQFMGPKKNFMTDYWTNHKFRKLLIPQLGKDVHPFTGHSMTEVRKKAFYINLKPEIHMFYTQTGMWFSRLVGKQFSCLTQVSNHCPGHENLSVKDKVGQALVNYAKDYKSRPQCFSTDKFFPETWVMLKPDQCREFFEIFNSPEYFKLKAERNIVYMRKIGSGVHQGKGVFPVTDEDEKYIRTLYNNGTNCGSVTENNIIQTFIHNPLLLENRKFHFRVFMYVASTNPFIVYYHDGYLRISFQEYDKNSKEMGTFVTNLGMTEILFQDKKGVGNRTVNEIKEDSYWYYPQFHKYLMEQGMVNDPNWLDNYLRAEMKKAMVHLMRMSSEPYWRKSSLTELYGVDFMMDENLNLWFIEANSGPLIQGWDDYTTNFFNKMLKDSFEISFGLLHSRVKRIIQYVNSIIKEKSTWSQGKGGIYLQNLAERREEFRELTMNRFEPEFEPSKNNEFYQIIDENQEGTKRYLGLLEEGCL